MKSIAYCVLRIQSLGKHLSSGGRRFISSPCGRVLQDQKKLHRKDAKDAKKDQSKRESAAFYNKIGFSSLRSLRLCGANYGPFCGRGGFFQPFNLALCLLILLLLLSACQTPAPTATVTAPDGVPTPPISTPLPGEMPTPSNPTEAARQATLGVVVPGRSGEPLRFTFPTPAPIPASRWRPPLYDVPWALGPNDHFYLTRPIAADEVNWPEWDYRYGGVIEGKELGHSGIDIAANRYTPIIAAGPGVVGWAGYGLMNRDDDINDPYGLAVLIEHDFGYNGHRVSTVYGHMERIDVTVGQRVVAGQQLGLVGITGNSTGPHLHFETRLQFGNYAATRNSELWLSPPQGWGVLVARLMRENSTPLYMLPVFVQSKATAQVWEVHTYGPTNIHYDDYYRENLVLSDLPAGEYEVSFTLKKEEIKNGKKEEKEEIKTLTVTIRPGGITYFIYYEDKGFSMTLPAPTPVWAVTPVK